MPPRPITLAVILGPIAAAAAQVCQPRWAPGFAKVDLRSATIQDAAVFDDGGGPDLYFSGDFRSSLSPTLPNYVARWNNPVLESIGGSFTGASEIEVLPTGNQPGLYVVGGWNNNILARWDGSAWTTMGGTVTGGSVDDLKALTFGGQTRLYIAGEFTNVGGTAAARVARWSGSAWQRLGQGMNDDVHTLVVHTDTRGEAIFAGGRFSLAGGNPCLAVARWNGINWYPLGEGLVGEVFQLLVFDAGNGPRLYAAGRTYSTGMRFVGGLAVWDGTRWDPAGGTPIDEELTIAVADLGSGPELYAAGRFASIGGTPALNIAKWDGTTWSALGGGIDQTGPGEPTVTMMHAFDSGHGPRLHVSGDFNVAGTVGAAHLAVWDGSDWYVPGNGLSNSVTSFAGDPSGARPLVAVGEFLSPAPSAGNYVARWDGETWQGVGGGVDRRAFAAAWFDSGSGPDLYVGGEFAMAGGSVAAPWIARWDGVQWAALPALNNAVRAVAVGDLGSGQALYAGGQFLVAGPLTVNRVARWNGLFWQRLRDGLDNTVYDLAIFDDGAGPSLYAAGAFLNSLGVGGAAVNRIARWDGSAWWPLAAGMNNTVYALEVFDDGGGAALYAAGDFTQAGGLSASRTARWDGAAWSALGLGLIGGTASALAAFNDGSGPALYAAGGFTHAGGTSMPNLARWDGSRWSPPAPGTTDAGILALAVHNDGPGPALFAGGHFSQAGGVASSRVAKLIGCPIPCYADCDLSTGPRVLDVFDFLCFQNRFAQNDPYACDCDTSSGQGVCDIFDFLCFQNAFGAGCP